MMTREFDCIDCGVRVVSFGVVAANDVDLCAHCLFVRDTCSLIDDVGERERTRTTLRSFLRLGQP